MNSPKGTPPIISYVDMPCENSKTERIVGVRFDVNAWAKWLGDSHPWLHKPIEWLRSKIEIVPPLLPFGGEAPTPETDAFEQRIPYSRVDLLEFARKLERDRDH